MGNKYYSVITGASKGLGKAIAIECAKRGFNLVLISLTNENIKTLAKHLEQKYKIEAKTYEADLTRIEELEKIALWINCNFKVNMLVNNAGIGGSNSFQDVSSQYIDNILLLNIRALVMLTHSLLPNIKKHTEAYILNIASMASFGPMPYKTVYPASKAFVYSFSRGLNTELNGTGITVCVAHPGGMATNDIVTQRINQYGKLVRSTILSPEITAQLIISRLLRKGTLIIPGFMNKVSYVFFKTCPVWLQLVLFRSSIKKEIFVQKKYCYA